MAVSESKGFLKDGCGRVKTEPLSSFHPRFGSAVRVKSRAVCVRKQTLAALSPT